jgi:hypothetical protein
MLRKPEKNWLEKATVRTRGLPLLDTNDFQGKFFYSETEAPYVAHELIRRRDPRVKERLLTRHILAHMNFTEQLEIRAVNPVVANIGYGSLDIKIPTDLRSRARETYTDEAWHAQIAGSLACQIRFATGLEELPNESPIFLERLARIQEKTDPAMRELTKLFFVIVSETMISGTLSRVPKDPLVVTAVRDMLRDHMVDEGRHQKDFSEIAKTVWPQMSTTQKAAIGPLLPLFIRAFIDPDVRHLQRILGTEGFTEDEQLAIIHDTFTPGRISTVARESSQYTVRLFARMGVFDDSAIVDAFAENGLFLPNSNSLEEANG